MSRALDLALAQQAAGKTIQQIANDIGKGRTAVSLWIRGVYQANGKNIEAAVIKAYDRRDCPHTGNEIAPDVCRKKALGAKPFGGSERRAWWLCCQTCPHKPEVSK